MMAAKFFPETANAAYADAVCQWVPGTTEPIMHSELVIAVYLKASKHRPIFIGSGKPSCYFCAAVLRGTNFRTMFEYPKLCADWMYPTGLDGSVTQEALTAEVEDACVHVNRDTVKCGKLQDFLDKLRRFIPRRR